MQRREFLATTLPAGVAATGLASSAALATSPKTESDLRQCYEWRTYKLFLADNSKLHRVHEYLKSAAVPAWKRMGLGPVGVFTEIGPDAGPSIHVLLVYPTALTVATARGALERDPEYQKAAAAYLAVKKDDPAFDRIESWLLLAFSAAPQITPPKGKPRAYELRTYMNHGEERLRPKVEMFNDGETKIFPECGFQNVFFGEALIGSGLPCLKYMLAAPDMAANQAGWKKFLAHPQFVKMKNDPKYANTEPNIVKLFLEPTDYSEV